MNLLKLGGKEKREFNFWKAKKVSISNIFRPICYLMGKNSKVIDKLSLDKWLKKINNLRQDEYIYCRIEEKVIFYLKGNVIWVKEIRMCKKI